MQYSELFLKHQMLVKQTLKIKEQLVNMPEGYISQKNISGKPYYYLQNRKNRQMHSVYIKSAQVNKTKQDLAMRKQLLAEMDAVLQEVGSIEKAAKMLDMGLYRRMIQEKRCLSMDAMPIAKRKQSLAFSAAMTSLEGVSPKPECVHGLTAWSEGKQSFSKSYIDTLRKYNLLGGEQL